MSGLFIPPVTATKLPVPPPASASSLLRFAHKTPKKSAFSRFLPSKPRSDQRYAQPDNRGFFAASSAKNLQAQQAASTLISLKSIFKKLTTKEHEGARKRLKTKKAGTLCSFVRFCALEPKVRWWFIFFFSSSSLVRSFSVISLLDNGKEFAARKALSRALGLDIYFAHPYHSWERGLNEHTSGLIRQYLPKKIPFDTLTRKQLDKIVDKINNRPRI
jgi:hypothetical protein